MVGRTVDVIIAGAGLSGASCARVLADHGYRVAVCERRSSVGGNAHDCFNEDGVFVHTYGPHIFHTSEPSVIEFVQRFGAWHTYEHRVWAQTATHLLEVPFNLNNLKKLYDADMAMRLTELLLQTFSPRTSVPIYELMEAHHPQIAQLGNVIYEDIFQHYSLKQWGAQDNFDMQVLRRVPVRLSTDNRYFTDVFQGLPQQGYTALVECMLDHPMISLHSEMDARTLFEIEPNRIAWLPAVEYALGCSPSSSCHLVWTGAVDELLDYRYGDLPYRSLELSFVTKQVRTAQPVATINYTSADIAYTRSTEFTLMTGQRPEQEVTTLCYERPHTFNRQAGHERFYPLSTQLARLQYERYVEHLSSVCNLTLLGRLGTYRYLDMDKVVYEGMEHAASLAAQLSR